MVMLGRSLVFIRVDFDLKTFEQRLFYFSGTLITISFSLLIYLLGKRNTSCKKKGFLSAIVRKGGTTYTYSKTFLL